MWVLLMFTRSRGFRLEEFEFSDAALERLDLEFEFVDSGVEGLHRGEGWG